MWYRFAQASSNNPTSYNPISGQGSFAWPEIAREQTNPKDIRLNFEPLDPEIYRKMYIGGTIRATGGGKELGYIEFFAEKYDESMSIEFIRVLPEYRNWGIGQMLYSEMTRFVRKNYPYVKSISGSIHSPEALDSRVESTWKAE